MYAYGFVIAVWMHSASVLPRTFIEPALAQSLFSRWVKFGPTVPVVPAASSVWQLPQPPGPTKIALPAAGLVADELDDPLELEPFELVEPEEAPDPRPGATSAFG